jgi:hypothetical protein
MVLLLNLLSYAIGGLILIAGYYHGKKTGKKAKSWAIAFVVMLLWNFLYTIARPSYLPKGTAAPMPRVPFEEIEEKPIQDRTKKPEMSTDERKQHFQETFTVREEVKEILKKEE